MHIYIYKDNYQYHSISIHLALLDTVVSLKAQKVTWLIHKGTPEAAPFNTQSIKLKKFNVWISSIFRRENTQVFYISVLQNKSHLHSLLMNLTITLISDFPSVQEKMETSSAQYRSFNIKPQNRQSFSTIDKWAVPGSMEGK